MQTKKNLILSIVKNYDFPFVEPFFKSLAKFAFNVEVVIFCSNSVSNMTKKQLRKYCSQLVYFDDQFPFIEIYEKSFIDIPELITINNYRFLLYLVYLKTNKSKYNSVMLTDVRDVIFQKNPFDEIRKNEISFFLEDNSQTFANSELNTQWYEDAFNIKISNTMLNEVVSCAGITIGNESGIIKYLEFLKSNMEKRNHIQWGIDQGLHNGYIYNYCEHFDLYCNDEPFVLTMGATKNFKTDKYGQLLNSKEEVYAIVHQYDRASYLFKYFKRKYIGPRYIQILKRILYKLFP